MPAVLAGAPSALATRIAAEPQVTLLADGQIPLTQLGTAIGLLVAAGADVTVRIQRADAALLSLLQTEGAHAVEWTVRAPTSGAARAWSGDVHEAHGLHAAIALAGKSQLAVRLRWQIAARTTSALGELAELSGHGAKVTVIALPMLEPAEAPPLDAVIAAWPTSLPDDVALVRSNLWPSCMPGSAVEPASQAERDAAAPRHTDACATCPIRARAGHPEGCAGVPAAILARVDGPGPDWRAAEQLEATSAQRAGPHVDVHCAEARGLALGLRRAWRLLLPANDVAAYRSVFSQRGWHVVTAATLDVGVGGTVRAGEGGKQVLMIVAVHAEDAATCLQAELANLHRAPAVTVVDKRAHWQAIAATHRVLGAHYGYPPCCVEAFLDAHAEIVEHVRETDNAIAVLRAALRTRVFDPRLTSLPGLIGEEARTPLRHLPCRFDCPASQALAAALATDLAQHNLVWTARSEALPPEPIAVFADGTCVSFAGHAVARDAIADVTGIRVRPSLVATPALVAQLEALAHRGDLEGVRVVPGLGLHVLHAGQWQPLPLPAQAAARASEFPILLPFGFGEA